MTDEAAVVQVQAVPQQHLQVSEDVAMVSMVERMARDPSVDVDKLARILELRYQLLEQAAMTKFNTALAEAQGEMEAVRKDCQNPSTRSRYASFYALDAAVRPVYTAHGFTVSFDTDPNASRDPLELMVVAYVSLGAYTRTYKIPMPADGKGARGGEVMTRTHAIGSAFTYGRRYLLSGIFNIATADSDDDGQAASVGQRRPPQPAPNPMPKSAPPSDPAPIPKGGAAVSTNEWKDLDKLLTEAAERGTAILATAWKNLSPAQQKAMNAAKERRYKPRALEVDAQGEPTDDQADDEAAPF